MWQKDTVIWDPEPRTTVLMRASSNLSNLTWPRATRNTRRVCSCTTLRVVREREIWSWVPWDPELRMTLLMRAGSDLTYQSTRATQGWMFKPHTAETIYRSLKKYLERDMHGNRCKVSCMWLFKFLSELPQMVSVVLLLCLEIGTSSIDWAQLCRLFTWGWRQSPVSKTLL
jgi:hypothetical protein